MSFYYFYFIIVIFISAQLEKQINWTKKCAALLKVPEEPPEDGSIKVPEILEEANLLEWGGISFGKGEIYRIFLSIKKLSESLPSEVEKLRFFGKITTRTLPYYIVEGLSPEDEENIDETKQEGRNGANKNAYWVTQSIESAAWTKLPNVTMEQVVAARQFKRFFTGDLQAPVPSYPPFKGLEINLLRTQIACIVGATSISPDGYYDLNEDDPPAVVPAEAEAMNERFPKTSGDLKDPEAWKHHETELNKIGKFFMLCTVYVCLVLVWSKSLCARVCCGLCKILCNVLFCIANTYFDMSQIFYSVLLCQVE